MSEHGQDFDGMRNFLEKYLFISDDTIELQMFQGCQNWFWISQGVLGSNFRAGHRKSVAWAIQLYMCVLFINIYILFFSPCLPKISVAGC